jgi:hypothetical protein
MAPVSDTQEDHVTTVLNVLASFDDVGRPLYLEDALWPVPARYNVNLANDKGTPFMKRGWSGSPRSMNKL